VIGPPLALFSMDHTLLPTIALSALGIAFFHAAIPTHWLPFVLTGRAQQWTHAKTLLVTILAGSGHVLFTAMLGVMLTWLGISLSHSSGMFPRIAGGALVLLGAFYLYRQASGISHSHSAGHHSHRHNSTASEHLKPYEKRMHELVEAKEPPKTTDLFAIATLIGLLTFSPCEAFVAFYVVGIRYGWMGFVLLTMLLLVGTVAGMTLFTWAALAGTRKLRFSLLDKYEHGLIGGLLTVIGVLVILVEK
jgi:nickel/cobalt exporter